MRKGTLHLKNQHRNNGGMIVLKEWIRFTTETSFTFIDIHIERNRNLMTKANQMKSRTIAMYQWNNGPGDRWKIWIEFEAKHKFYRWNNGDGHNNSIICTSICNRQYALFHAVPSSIWWFYVNLICNLPNCILVQHTNHKTTRESAAIYSVSTLNIFSASNPTKHPLLLALPTVQSMKRLFPPILPLDDPRCKATIPHSLETVNEAVLYISGEIQSPPKKYPLYVSYLNNQNHHQATTLFKQIVAQNPNVQKLNLF